MNNSLYGSFFINIFMLFKPKRIKEKLETLKKDPSAASYYAVNVLKDRWPGAEPYIKQDASAAYLYATHIIKGRWPEAEPYIMKDPEIAELYAIAVLRKRWPEAEPFIKTSPDTWYSYRKHFKIK